MGEQEKYIKALIELHRGLEHLVEAIPILQETAHGLKDGTLYNVHILPIPDRFPTDTKDRDIKIPSLVTYL